VSVDLCSENGIDDECDSNDWNSKDMAIGLRHDFRTSINVEQDKLLEEIKEEECNKFVDYCFVCSYRVNSCTFSGFSNYHTWFG